MYAYGFVFLVGPLGALAFFIYTGVAFGRLSRPFAMLVVWGVAVGAVIGGWIVAFGLGALLPAVAVSSASGVAALSALATITSSSTLALFLRRLASPTVAKWTLYAGGVTAVLAVGGSLLNPAPASMSSSGGATITSWRAGLSLTLGVISPILWHWMVGRSLLAWSKEVLRNRRRPSVCLNCGYSLAGITVGTPCPECGTVRTLPAGPTRRAAPTQSD